MSEIPVDIAYADEPGDVDTIVTITMSIRYGTDLDLFAAYLTDELQTLSHDTFKQNWG